jgi:hypothetical protein
MIKIKSIFEQIATQIFTMKDINAAKTFISEFVNDKNINEQDKKLILNNIRDIKNIIKLQTYICNSLLKYEGMSVNKVVNEKVETLGLQD